MYSYSRTLLKHACLGHSILVYKLKTDLAAINLLQSFVGFHLMRKYLCSSQISGSPRLRLAHCGSSIAFLNPFSSWQNLNTRVSLVQHEVLIG